ncbi:hypothetical protein WKI68_02280 [Streptomyces sp. MS1.HAVA.3]|uniref:Secreted protein n=1 Tax=Streptomyces caledonius TaxID=3134107 RepID=A0ABU8TY92_9ACTN
MDVQITTALIGAVAGTVGGTVLGSWLQARGGRAQAVAARDAATTAAETVAVYSGRRSATAVRMAPRLTSWARARAAMERPSRYTMRTASVFPAGTVGRRPPLLPFASAARSPS